MKRLLILFAAVLVFWACGSDAEKANTNSEPEKTEQEEKMDDKSNKGIGEFTKVVLNDPLDQEMVARGEAIYEMKCSACHKKTDMRVVGPGFKGVTDKRTPEWIMNMITNVEVMLEQDESAQELLKECLVRMPNQNLSGDDARDILEWLYDNDAAE